MVDGCGPCARVRSPYDQIGILAGLERTLLLPDACELGGLDRQPLGQIPQRGSMLACLGPRRGQCELQARDARKGVKEGASA